MVRLRSPAPIYVSVPEWPQGADCKSVVCDFGGPNPPAPTRKSKTYDLLFSVIFAPFAVQMDASYMHFVRDIAFGSDMRFARWK